MTPSRSAISYSTRTVIQKDVSTVLRSMSSSMMLNAAGISANALLKIPTKYRTVTHFSPNDPAKMPASAYSTRIGKRQSVMSRDTAESPRMKYAAVRNGSSMEKMHRIMTMAPSSLPRITADGLSVVSME